jgi:hypothetical protein
LGGQRRFGVALRFEITGPCLSDTVTVNVQEAPLPDTVTVVVPTGKNDPEAGVDVTFPQSPDVVAAG